MMTRTDEADAPLDPALERVRRKMIRLLAISIGIMFIGLIAVLASVVYRTSGRTGLPPDGRGVIALPAGSQVREIALDGGRALLRVEASGRQELRLIDMASGAALAVYALGAEPPETLAEPAR